ncbi:MAG: hypothetical protein CVU56_27020 [Deltaproteobacteria bacterium HGW-Deltaproteobacteria-14]|jgi:flagellar basal-body rod modification protein FlgD|nr:MAG: hypothetical protein CVU56_27020 [Deltaproteobacteria bacterium HGW-Deltaproteobacteria-14]
MTTSISTSAQSPYDPTAAAAVSTQANGALGKEDFLQLLVAQLSHQDPLSPTDPTEFVSQLSQFSSLEQLMNLKDGLDLLAVTQTAGTSAQMVSFIGKSVVFEGDQVSWHTGDAPTSADYQLAGAAKTVSVTIRDAAGTAVNSYELGAQGKGDHTAPFSGLDRDGKPLPEGTYTVEITAKDIDGNSVAVSQRSTAVVAGVTFEHGYPEIVLADGRTLGLGQILKVIGEQPDPVAVAAPVAEPTTTPTTTTNTTPVIKLPGQTDHPKTTSESGTKLPTPPWFTTRREQ